MDFKRFASTETSALVERLVAAMQAEVDATRQQLQTTADSARDEAAAQAKLLQLALDESRAETRTLQDALEKANDTERGLRASIDSLKADHAKRRASLAEVVRKVRDRCAATQAEVERISAAKAAADAEYQTAYAQWSDDLRAARATCAANASADLEFLRGAFARIDAAASVTEAVNELAQRVAAVFPRVALFDVHETQLVGRWDAGFESRQNIARLIVPITEASPFDKAVQSGELQRLDTSGSAKISQLPLGGTPGAVLLLPVVIEGRTVAVIYADDSGSTDQPLSFQRAATSAELLVLHAAPFLDRLASQEKIAAYDSQLLNQLKIV